MFYGDDLTFADGSLSARRAWIEMAVCWTGMQSVTVALRKESVDRNVNMLFQLVDGVASLSARRAWIEIVGGPIAAYPVFPSLSARRAWIEISAAVTELLILLVALRKESVDRNGCNRQNWVIYIYVALRKESVDRNLYLFSFALVSLCRSPQGERG